jgi:hypothetical protein
MVRGATIGRVLTGHAPEEICKSIRLEFLLTSDCNALRCNIANSVRVLFVCDAAGAVLVLYQHLGLVTCKAFRRMISNDQPPSNHV